MADGGTSTTSENQYPWNGVPRVLRFSSESNFKEFLNILTAAMRKLSLVHHFDSLTSLVNLHQKFCLSSSWKLEEVWRSIPQDECATMKELTCVGLAMNLKEFILRDTPEWEDCIGFTITNEWTSKQPVAETFWTSTNPPSFPLQCREHSLLFVRVILEDKRNAVVLLDPGRCLATPLVATEDGLPPQSPKLVLKRFKKFREHAVTWGGPDYVRWTIGTRKEDHYFETHLRVYVGRNFRAGSFLDWHNLMFPYRAIMFMTPSNSLAMCLRVEVGTTSDHAVMLVTEENFGVVNQFVVPFESESAWDECQTTSMEAISEKIGRERLLVLMDGLNRCLNDQNFVSQFLDIWEKVKQETENSFSSFVLNVANNE